MSSRKLSAIQTIGCLEWLETTADLPRTSPCSVQRQWIGWTPNYTFGPVSLSRSDADGEDG